jgi:hypothetical protein
MSGLVDGDEVAPNQSEFTETGFDCDATAIKRYRVKSYYNFSSHSIAKLIGNFFNASAMYCPKV